MNRKFILLLAGLVSVSVLLSGCLQEPLPLDDEGDTSLITDEDTNSNNPPEEEKPVLPEIALPTVFALPYHPAQTMDPITCADGMQQTVGSLIYEGLYKLNQNFQPVPVLCGDYWVNADWTVYTFELREGILFSDGTAVTPMDVRDTLNRARSSSRYASRLAHITNITANRSHLVITLNKSNTAFTALLDIPIVKSNTEYHTFPTGTGPYCLSSDRKSLVPNPYWHEGSPPLDKIALSEATDSAAMVYRFTSHDVQLLAADLTSAHPLVVSGSTEHYSVDTTTLIYLGCNMQRQPMNHPIWRRVLNMGLDREHIVSALLSGHGLATQFPISPTSSLYPADLEEPYSQETFAKSVTDYNLSWYEPLILLVNEENPFRTAICQDIAASWSQVGIPIKVRALPWDDYQAALNAGDFDLYYAEVRLTADWNLAPLLCVGGAMNYSQWDDESTENVVWRFGASVEREEAARTACVWLKSQSSILPICFKRYSVLAQPGVIEGLNATMQEPLYNLTECVFHLAENTTE